MKAYYVTCNYKGESCFLLRRGYGDREWIARSNAIPEILDSIHAFIFKKMQENSENYKSLIDEWAEDGYTDFCVHEIELTLT